MGNTSYPNHKGNYYYRNHTLYHIGTLDPLGIHPQKSPQATSASASAGAGFEGSGGGWLTGLTWGNVGFRVQGSGLGFRVYGLRFRGLGFRG